MQRVEFALLLAAVLALVGCGRANPPGPQAESNVGHHEGDGHDHSGWWCAEHGVPEAEYRALMISLDFSVANLSYAMNRDEDYFEYHMNLRTANQSTANRLTGTLSKMDGVIEFRISPSGD